MNHRAVLNLCIFLCAATSIVLDYMGSMGYFFLKPITTVLVILLPLLVKGSHQAFRKLLVAALCFCLLGDLFLLNDEYFLFGLGAFFVAHLLFAKAFVRLEGFQKNVTTAIVLLGIGAGLYLWLYPDLGALKYPVAAYVLVILVMAWQGIAVYQKQRKLAYGFFALGALLFMFSDSMIAVDKFKTPFELSGMVILASYWLAIALIANAGLLILNEQ